jgi:hypothetical protein
LSRISTLSTVSRGQAGHQFVGQPEELRLGIEEAERERGPVADNASSARTASRSSVVTTLFVPAPFNTRTASA